MKIHHLATLLLLAIVCACEGVEIQSPELEASWEPAEAPHRPSRAERAEAAHEYAADHPPAVDPRTDDQIADDACKGASGWKCPNRKRPAIMAAAGTFGPQPSWGVPVWKIDWSNVSTCASDGNTCTSSTCAANGVGPCKSFIGGVEGRWGTDVPSLPQQTTLDFISDDPEQFEIIPRILGNLPSSALNVTGAFHQVTTGLLGTVVQKNRAGDQLLTADLGQSPSSFVGDLLTDTARGSSMWIDSIVAGNVVVLSQPLPVPFSGGVGLCEASAVSPEADTVTAGDAYTITTPVKLGLTRLDPSCENIASSFLGCACAQNFWVSDPTGTPSMSAFEVGLGVDMEQARVDPNMMIRATRMNQEPSAYYNIFMNGALQDSVFSQNAPQIFGGSIYTSNAQGGSVASNGQFILDGDVIVHGFIVLSGTGSLIGAAYFDHHADLGGRIFLQPNIDIASVWGPGIITFDAQTSFVYPPGGSFSSVFKLAGGFRFGRNISIATGCAFDTSVDPAVWHCGRALDAAHVDLSIASGGFGGAALDPFLNISVSKEQ